MDALRSKIIQMFFNQYKIKEMFVTEAEKRIYYVKNCINVRQ